ncbi:MAG: MerR family transcriptional regulator [Lachnospiraceae bacterium]|nr:MerR family transcriptional regulator [Lachnospiraceae bacterium]
MENLVKIRDMTAKYDLSARTLRYYEDMGLIKSTRSGDYAYRLYDEANVKRLEQILILHKLNISIKDIQRIFDTTSSEIVLEVLGKKVDNIDEEISLLHELKGIVLEFIRQIESADFARESDVKLLYDKAKELKTQITMTGYNGNPSTVNRLLEVTEKLDDKVPDIMIVRIPKFRAVTSGLVTFDELFGGGFEPWQEAHNHFFKPVLFDAPDFLCGKDGMAEWLWAVKDEITSADTTPYEVVEFPGGLYAVAVSVDGDGESQDKVRGKIEKWLGGTNFVVDNDRALMGHMIYVDDEIKEGLGYHQMNLYTPIKLRK